MVGGMCGLGQLTDNYANAQSAAQLCAFTETGVDGQTSASRPRARGGVGGGLTLPFVPATWITFSF
jgi:hypothetical protein